MRNGRLTIEGFANKNPAKTGAMAARVVRAAPVMPAVEDRSSARTMVIVYECLVGTSIWLMLKRSRSTRIARGRLGISGTMISRMLEGRCVYTMVLTKPNRDASRDATNAE